MKALRIVSMMNFVYTYCMLPITAMSERRREVSVLDFWNEFSISFMELWLGPFFLDRMEVAETLLNAFAFALLGSFSELHSVAFTRQFRALSCREKSVSTLLSPHLHTHSHIQLCDKISFLKMHKIMSLWKIQKFAKVITINGCSLLCNFPDSHHKSGNCVFLRHYM